MSLYERMMDDECILYEKVRTPDGYGGWTTVWTEGSHFMAAVKKDQTLQARIAEKDGLSELYTITVSREFPLDFHDVFKRISDGQYFRVTSRMKDNTSPEFSSINFGQVTAEAYILE